MTGYRIADDITEPLAVDPEQVQKQRFRQQVALHLGLSVITLGIWLPVLIYSLFSGGARKLADGYGVRIRGGILTVGNASTSTSMPLETIDRVSMHSGLLHIVQRAPNSKSASPITVFGLRDPAAAMESILEAREDHVQRVRVAPGPQATGAAQEAEREAEAPASRRRR